MNASAVPTSGVSAQRARGVLATFLLGITLVAIWYLWRFVTPYASIDPTYYDYLWPWRHALWAHLAGGLSALLIGPVQLWLGLTRRRLRLHRLLGRIYLGTAIVSLSGGLVPDREGVAW